MKSIRNRLLCWLLSGVAVLLVVAGTCVFFTVRYVLLDRVDTELQQARKIVYNLFERDALDTGIFVEGNPSSRRTPRVREIERWREFDLKNGKLLYQVRIPNGDILQRSASLGERTIVRPEVIPDPRRAVTVEMTDGSHLRARIDYAGPGKRPLPKGRDVEPGFEIIVARDISEIYHTLSLLVAGIWAVGLAAAAATTGLVTLLLRKVLSPLRKLGREVSRIDATSLTARFDDEAMPRELLPITERLNSLMARLESSFERERRFSSDLAHEMRTPIAELSAMAEAAIRFPDKVPPDQFDDILASTREMQRIVESLLALARWEEGSSELDMEDVDVAEIVEECWAPCSRAAEEKQLDVSLALTPGQSLKTDPGLFRHILNNLFSNAVEYTPRGGQVTIETLAGESGSATGLSVSNSVEEMEPSEVPHLFERFWRRDPSRTGSGHSGLGLSVARACAKTLSLELAAKLEEGLLRFDLSTEGIS